MEIASNEQNPERDNGILVYTYIPAGQPSPSSCVLCAECSLDLPEQQIGECNELNPSY